MADPNKTGQANNEPGAYTERATADDRERSAEIPEFEETNSSGERGARDNDSADEGDDGLPPGTDGTGF